MTLHLVDVQERRVNMAPRVDCAPECPADGGHIHEYRAPMIRPTAAQTAAFRALDARGADDPQAAAG
jgi:hypothetical protein